ncbi:DUF2635 domain-containing protein [Citrobacter freundii]|nr:DUF2635 domain-containing protein [Citrobacter freundii]MBC6508296.1 DUF2635 domain-containing protein [Citrobacter freundii]
MTMKRIKPVRAGLNVRRPDSELLNNKGEDLPLTAYWIRRQAEGDVVISDIPKDTAAPKAVTTTKKVKAPKKQQEQ